MIQYRRKPIVDILLVVSIYACMVLWAWRWNLDDHNEFSKIGTCQPSPVLLQIKSEIAFRIITHILTLDSDGYYLLIYVETSDGMETCLLNTSAVFYLEIIMNKSEDEDIHSLSTRRFSRYQQSSRTARIRLKSPRVEFWVLVGSQPAPTEEKRREKRRKNN